MSKHAVDNSVDLRQRSDIANGAGAALSEAFIFTIGVNQDYTDAHGQEKVADIAGGIKACRGEVTNAGHGYAGDGSRFSSFITESSGGRSWQYFPGRGDRGAGDEGGV